MKLGPQRCGLFSGTNGPSHFLMITLVVIISKGYKNDEFEEILDLLSSADDDDMLTV